MDQRVVVVVNCPDCVETRVPLRDVTLRHCEDDETWSYRFVCPICLRPSVEPTDVRTAHEAALAGTRFENWRLPAELLEHRDGPPITVDDLFDLREAMQEPDWIDALIRAGESR